MSDLPLLKVTLAGSGRRSTHVIVTTDEDVVVGELRGITAATLEMTAEGFPVAALRIVNPGIDLDSERDG